MGGVRGRGVHQLDDGQGRQARPQDQLRARARRREAQHSTASTRSKNVGYEYVDKLDSDSDAFTKEVRAKFDSWMKEKKVAILFIEVKKNPDAATLKGKIVKFLNTVKKAPMTPGAL